MARRSDHSREELYELAMDAARDIVEADGLRALTARNVADAIGYSPGTLYNLFENLDDLIVQLNGRTLDEIHDRLAANPLTKNPRVDLERLLDGYLIFLAEHGNLWSVLFEHNLAAGHSLPDWYLVKTQKVLGLVEDALAPLYPEAERGAVPEVARILWAGLHGICSLSGSGKLRVVTERSARELARTLLVLLLSGVQAQTRKREG